MTSWEKVTHLPPKSFVVMVMRSHADRVEQWLLDTATGWNGAGNSKKRPLPQEEAGTCRVLFSEQVTGVRKERRGYKLLFLQNAARTIFNLSPVARQQISWAAELTHELLGNDITNLGVHIVSSIKDTTNIVLRVDTFPKQDSEQVCRSLQQAAGSTDSNPYEGPIQMTRSATKCTHVLIVIRHSEGFIWGVASRKIHFATPVNQDATKELNIQATDPQTGRNLSLGSVNVEAPVSRAYFKLQQVWDDVLLEEGLEVKNTAGIDLGASPGGWTQVLRQYISLSHVLSIDPGVLASRVKSLQGVKHLMADMASQETANAIEELPHPVSMLVCDASVDSVDILNKLVHLFTLTKQEAWALPMALVLTLKMPYKTVNSLNRNIEKSKASIPSQLDKIRSLAYPDDKAVGVRYQIVHLMANSDSERTLVAIFDKQHSDGEDIPATA